MCDSPTPCLAAFLFPITLITAFHACLGGEKAPARYLSPTEVFNAYRKAQGSREWRTLFSL